MYPATRCLRDDEWRLGSRNETGWSSAGEDRTTAAEVRTPLRISASDQVKKKLKQEKEVRQEETELSSLNTYKTRFIRRG